MSESAFLADSRYMPILANPTWGELLSILVREAVVAMTPTAEEMAEEMKEYPSMSVLMRRMP